MFLITTVEETTDESSATFCVLGGDGGDVFVPEEFHRFAYAQQPGVGDEWPLPWLEQTQTVSSGSTSYRKDGRAPTLRTLDQRTSRQAHSSAAAKQPAEECSCHDRKLSRAP